MCPLKYAIRNSKGEYAGEGSKIEYQLDGESKHKTCTIKSVTSCSIINTTDDDRFSAYLIKDFMLLKEENE